MTTTVRVEARAWGARIETNGETVELGAHQDRAFQIAEGESQTFTVIHGEKPVDRAAELADEEVPGRRQNDQLLGQGAGAQTSEPVTSGDQSGTSETTAASEETVSNRGRRGGHTV